MELNHSRASSSSSHRPHALREAEPTDATAKHPSPSPPKRDLSKPSVAAPPVTELSVHPLDIVWDQMHPSEDAAKSTPTTVSPLRAHLNEGSLSPRLRTHRASVGGAAHSTLPAIHNGGGAATSASRRPSARCSVTASTASRPITASIDLVRREFHAESGAATLTAAIGSTITEEEGGAVPLRKRTAPKEPARPETAATSIGHQPHSPLRHGGSVPGIEKAIRRASLSCRSTDLPGKQLDSAEAETYFKTKKLSMFGVYSVREVMAVIRLFKMLDADKSSTISLTELQRIRSHFEKAGQFDLMAVFQNIDKDSNGQINLRELLVTCFPHATPVQVDEMLCLGKFRSIEEYFRAQTRQEAVEEGAPPPVKTLDAAHRQELIEIFHLFDKDGDGFISMDEIMQAVRATSSLS